MMRFHAGYLSVSSAVVFPSLAIITLIAAHLSMALLQRLVTRERDIASGYTTTGTVFPPLGVNWIATISMAIFAMSMVLLSLAGRVPFISAAWGALPWQTLLVLLPVLGFLPTFAGLRKSATSYSLQKLRYIGWGVFAVLSSAEFVLILIYSKVSVG